jgi:hypothetical protein
MKSKNRRRTQSGVSFSGLQRREEVIEFNPDYTYIKRDLRRIVILAGSIFVVLIALAFILPMFVK